MSHRPRFDHVGLTVADLDAVTTFFVGLGLEVENRMFVEGEFRPEAGQSRVIASRAPAPLSAPPASPASAGGIRRAPGGPVDLDHHALRVSS